MAETKLSSELDGGEGFESYENHPLLGDTRDGRLAINSNKLYASNKVKDKMGPREDCAGSHSGSLRILQWVGLIARARMSASNIRKPHSRLTPHIPLQCCKPCKSGYWTTASEIC